jgi:dihydroneopterin aldolase
VSDVIELRGLRVCAIVGVLAEEREREQPLLIDIDFERPFRDAAVSDDLAATTNYADVIVVAERIAAAVLEFDRAIESVHVRAHKLRPPVPHDIATVGVSCTVRRES